MKVITLAPAAVLAILPTLGPAQIPGRSSTSATSGRSPSDVTLESRIRQKFAQSKSASMDRFTVRVAGGVAVIEGKTSVPQRKGAATRMAKAAGARSVDNRIQVSEEGKAKARASLEKANRRAEVQRPR